MTEPVIEIADLRFAYGEHQVLQGIGFTVMAGEIYGLVGPDGAGKSTLIRITVGALTPAQGTVRVLGRAPADPALRAQLAYMPQGFALYLDLSVQENLEFFADLHGLSQVVSQRRIRELLARTGLEGFEERRAGHLSGGMMQKLALACALISEPQVMFLDEPTTGVDPLSRRSFWRLLDGVRAEGVAILYATANIDEAERCDRIAFLESGRLTRQGTPVELAVAKDALLVSVTGPNARDYRQALRELQGVSLVFPVGARLHVWLEPGLPLADFLAALATISPELGAEVITPTLHDAALRELALAGARS